MRTLDPHNPPGYQRLDTSAPLYYHARCYNPLKVSLFTSCLKILSGYGFVLQADGKRLALPGKSMWMGKNKLAIN